MNRNEFLMMREELMVKIENNIDDTLLSQDFKDGLVTEICDLICERLDPVGLE